MPQSTRRLRLASFLRRTSARVQQSRYDQQGERGAASAQYVDHPVTERHHKEFGGRSRQGKRSVEPHDISADCGASVLRGHAPHRFQTKRRERERIAEAG